MKNGWSEKKLCELYSFKNGINFTKHQKVDRGILTIDVLNMYGDDLYVDVDDLYRVDKDVNGEYILQEGDLLVVRSSVKREGVAWAKLFRPVDEPVTFCGFIIRGRPVSNTLPEYIVHFLRCPNTREKLIRSAKQSTITNINQARLGELAVPIPPLPEQRRIVGILDEAFAGIATAKAHAQQNLHNARALFESHLNAVFTQRGEEWDDTMLGEACENLDSKRVPITKNKRVSGEYPYYGASGIVDYVNDYIFDEDLLLVSEDGANLLARTYPIAFSVSGKVWVNNHAHVLRFPNMASQRFMEFYLNSIRLDPYVSGMAQPKLNQKSLNSIPVPSPPIPQRKAIVANLDALSEETQRLESIYQRKLAALGELKKSLLHQAFSGEL